MFILFLIGLLTYVDFTTVVLFAIVAYLTWKYYNEYDFPPGPRGLPFLGYLPFMPAVGPEIAFNNFSKKYGHVMSVYFRSKLTVVLNNFEAIKEAFVKQGDNFTGRSEHGSRIDNDDSGVFIMEGEPWKDHRRFIMSTLRDYGMGKLSLEPRIMEEIHYLMNELALQKGKPYDFTQILGMSTANIISTMEFGKRFDYKDERFMRLRSLQDEELSYFSHTNPSMFFPFLQKNPFLKFGDSGKRLMEINKELKQFIREIIREHKAEYEDDSRKDLVDAFVTEANDNISKTGNAGSFGEIQTVGTLEGLFQAGTETTTSTLRWAILFLLVYPETQNKIQKEIDEVIGMERDATMSDKMKMAYTEAFLHEVQRVAVILPLNAAHTNVEEAVVFGYRIPKRTTILTNLWAVHNDPKLWGQPDKFMPERFINKEGKLQKPEYLIPFGIGKRACAGESLARMELFLYFTSFLQRFTFEPPKGVTPVIQFDAAFVRRPKPYQVCAIERPGYSA